MLDTILDRPLANADDYADALHLHRTTFYRQQRQMLRTVAALLAEPAASAGAGQAFSALHQLRAPISDFMGRESELDTLVEAAERGAGHEPRAVIGAIHGMGGVGKTELAFALAHRLRAQFPDAQLVLELRGARETPMTPIEALQAAIRSFAPQEQLPAELDALQQRYRSLLDGKRVLVLLDDARDAAQVRPLVPPVGCLLLVTSRQRWTLPGMASVQLAPLGSDEAPAFLRQLCARLTDAEAAAIAAACDQLPLALRVSGSLLAINPALSAERYIQRLGDARRRLEQLRDPDDALLNVAASLELSYAALEPAAQRLLRQLAVLVADFDTELALATAALPDGMDAEEELHALLRRNVIIYDAARDRWRLHDLVRALALGKLARDEEAATRERYARAALEIARQANRQYLAGGTEMLKALDRFDTERPHIDEVWRWGKDGLGIAEIDKVIVDATLNTYWLGSLRYHPKLERRSQIEMALAAAVRLGQAAEESELLHLSGINEDRLGNIAEAIDFHSRSLEILKTTGDKKNLAKVTVYLAQGYQRLGSPDNSRKALELYKESLKIYEGIENVSHELNTCLNNLGALYNKINELESALYYFGISLTRSMEAHDKIAEARAYCNIANCLRRLGKYDESLALCEKALVIIREL
ncbi:MAG TPA: NB-ARC domain-containing protein, partial [Herpetosiphonaceae bacterium]